ncbi:MAG: hypothetical protein CM15mP25_6340 [Gammaproteobacteria bacterium]|nr:MAG: hypothetical protein CM15mP25_6340 [Gammaproteobacteria bacterium]
MAFAARLLRLGSLRQDLLGFCTQPWPSARGTAPMIFASVYDATGSYDLGYSYGGRAVLSFGGIDIAAWALPKEYEGGH